MKRISETEMVKKTGALIGIDAVENFDMLSAYLDLAESKILNRQYPFGVPDDTEVEERYQQVQIEIAIFLYNKREQKANQGTRKTELQEAMEAQRMFRLNCLPR